MRNVINHTRMAGWGGALALIGALMLGGCASPDTKVRVDPFGVPGKAALNADTVAAAMTKAGFDRDQILDNGPAVRNAIAQQGGVRVRQGDFVRAMFMIHDGGMYGVAANRGTFRIDLDRGQLQDLGADAADNYLAPIP